MEPIVYREMKPGEEQSVCELVTDVFHEYVASDYEQGGIEEFFRYANPDAMKARMHLAGFVLVAQRAYALVGMLEFSPPNCISMLFVSLRHQGIATELVKQAISKARSSVPELSKLIVHSSRYAVPIYQKMGFRKTGKATTENGITYFPMELLIENEIA